MVGVDHFVDVTDASVETIVERVDDRISVLIDLTAVRSIRAKQIFALRPAR